MFRIVLDDCGIEKDLPYFVERNVLFHHLLMRVHRDAQRVARRLLSEARSNRTFILKIDVYHIFSPPAPSDPCRQSQM
jgi:hypothetical protein